MIPIQARIFTSFSSNKSTKKLETKINTRYTRNNQETMLCPRLEFCEFPSPETIDVLQLLHLYL